MLSTFSTAGKFESHHVTYACMHTVTLMIIAAHINFRPPRRFRSMMWVETIIIPSKANCHCYLKAWLGSAYRTAQRKLQERLKFGATQTGFALRPCSRGSSVGTRHWLEYINPRSGDHSVSETHAPTKPLTRRLPITLHNGDSLGPYPRLAQLLD